jgi:hypothetical protein
MSYVLNAATVDRIVVESLRVPNIHAAMYLFAGYLWNPSIHFLRMLFTC